MLKLVYDYVPIWVQNLLISLYGANLRRERFGTKYKETFRTIDLECTPTQKALEIGEFLTSAARDVPYYKENTDFVVHHNKSEVSLDRLINEFPILEKSTIRDCSGSLLSDRFKGKLINVSTSGSTGSPLKIYMDRHSREINYAFFHKFLETIGVNEFDRSATFAGRVLIPSRQKKPPFWRINMSMNTLLLSSYHISMNSCLSYIKEMERFDPLYIDSYPSAIYELALFLDKLGYSPVLKVKAIITSSETLFSYQRELIEEIFGCPIYDFYGCAEQSVLAFQTPYSNGEYVVPSQYCLVEVLNDKSQPVLPGQSGRVVCTNIFNSAAPVIRYEIGDNAVLGEYYPGTCFARRLSAIEGRADDVVITPSGQKVGRLDPIFKGIGGIEETQIVQESINLLTLNIVTVDSKPINEKKLITFLKHRIGSEMDINIVYMQSIPRSRTGKFRAVLSKIQTGSE